MLDVTHASASYSQQTHAPVAAVWAAFTAVADWREWNAGVHASALEGPFREGAWFSMTLPDHVVLRSQLIDVEAPHRFTDQTSLGDITVRVRHEVMPSTAGTCTITYTVDVTGPDAQQVCDQVSADFPDVLSALAARVEGQAQP